MDTQNEQAGASANEQAGASANEQAGASAPAGSSSAPPALISLKRGERIQAHANAQDASIVVTDSRLVVASDASLMLDVPFDRIRRIQFDIERARPAVLVVVPEWPSDPPQVLSVPPDAYEAMAKVLTYIGIRIHPDQ